MTRLDNRERELGLPSSSHLLVDRPSPVRTPGFRGYFANETPVPAEIITRYPHLTTVQALAAAVADGVYSPPDASLHHEQNAAERVRADVRPS
eukprot:2544059-Pleurochrysis_carterae.AAC.1